MFENYYYILYYIHEVTFSETSVWFIVFKSSVYVCKSGLSRKH